MENLKSGESKGPEIASEHLPDCLNGKYMALSYRMQILFDNRCEYKLAFSQRDTTIIIELYVKIVSEKCVDDGRIRLLLESLFIKSIKA
jgi:hypothetical protein